MTGHAKAKRLEGLSLTAFRGATCRVDLSFDASKPVIMIFGESGSGKSSIIDALDFVCNESAGPLAERKSTPVKEYLPALSSDARTVRVEIRSGGHDWVGSLDGAAAKVVGPPGRPRARILRRNQILRVIEAPPAQRYDELRRFIAVPGVEKAEATLREAHRSVDENLDRAVSAKAQAESALQELWTAEGSPAPAAAAWAKSKAEQDSRRLAEKSDEASKLLESLTSLATAAERLHEAETAAGETRNSLNAAEAALADAEASSRVADAALLRLLEMAGEYVAAHADFTECPVCEQAVDPAVLAKRLSDRRLAAQALASAVRDATKAKRSLESRAESLDREQVSVVPVAKEVVSRFKGAKLDSRFRESVDWDHYSDLFVEPPNGRAAERAALAIGLYEGCKPLEKLLTDERDSITADLAKLNAVRLHHRSLEKHTAGLTELAALKNRLEGALDLVEGRRKGYVDRVLASITGRVDGLYKRLHPGEGLGDVRFQLDPARRGSLNFFGRFHDASDIPPQAYYSESHLDTLGICIFLALGEYYAEDAAILVLDDVLTSTDQDHLDRFIDLLHEEFNTGPQILLTTHYRPWRDRYRYARGPVGNVQLIELLPWSPLRGISHTKTKLEIEELEERLSAEPLNRQSVASRAGVLLESLLEHLAARYECAIPYRPAGNHPLGDFFAGLDGKLRKLLKVTRSGSASAGGAAEIEVRPLLDRVQAMTWVRDLDGAHFNLAGMDIPDSQVREFGQATCSLVRAIVCPTCGQLPRRNVGSGWACHCGGTHLSPLAAPGRHPTNPEET